VVAFAIASMMGGGSGRYEKTYLTAAFLSRRTFLKASAVVCSMAARIQVTAAAAESARLKEVQKKIRLDSTSTRFRPGELGGFAKDARDGCKFRYEVVEVYRLMPNGRRHTPKQVREQRTTLGCVVIAHTTDLIRSLRSENLAHAIETESASWRVISCGRALRDRY